MSDVKKDDINWSDVAVDNRVEERRSGIDRRQYEGARAMTIPDMRSGEDRRKNGERRKVVRLTITGRAMDV